MTRPPWGRFFRSFILWSKEFLRSVMFIVFIFRRYSVHFVDFGLYPSMSDFKFSSSWDHPSTLWTLVYIRPWRTSNFHPPGMIHPLFGSLFVFVHFGHVIFTHLDDPSILWTLCLYYPFTIKIHVENHGCIWIFLLKENASVEKVPPPLGLKRHIKSKNCSKKKTIVAKD